MRASLRHYLSVYFEFARTSISTALSFRISFTLLMMMDILFYGVSLSTVDFIYDHVGNIGPWNREQLMFFISYIVCVDHLHMGLVSESFWRFSDDIKTGNLDFILLKPTHSLFNIFFRYIRPSTILLIPIAWGQLYYFGVQAKLEGNDWILIPPLLILSFILLVIMEIIITTSTFWLKEGMAINFIRMQLQGLSRWPHFIFLGKTRKIMTFIIPISLIGSAPIHLIFERSAYEMMLYLVLMIFVLFLLLLKLWERGLRHYDSASS